jgi:signal transduction histidine kinase
MDRFAGDQSSMEWFGMSYPEFRKDLFRLIENMKNGSDRITSIVNDLRQFTRKKDSVEIRPVEIKDVITRIVNICHGKIKNMVRTFEINVPAVLPHIPTDPDILEQVIMNFLINAAQAADKEDSWIRLEVKKGDSPQNPLIIEVTDNGKGMDEETMRNVFDPFFTTKLPGEGTGLGLYISHNLVQSIGGRIEVESQPGKGSILRILLPAAEDQGPLERRTGGFRIPGRGSGSTDRRQ